MAPLSIQIDVDNAAGLNSECRKTLEGSIKRFADDVFATATLYESRSRGNSSSQVQFTTAHLSDANAEVRRAGLKPTFGSKLTAFLLRLFLYIAAAGIGVGGNNLPQTWGAAMFWASLTGGLVMVGILEARGWKGGE